MGAAPAAAGAAVAREGARGGAGAGPAGGRVLRGRASAAGREGGTAERALPVAAPPGRASRIPQCGVAC